jgi:N-methylhydantoinase A
MGGYLSEIEAIAKSQSPNTPGRPTKLFSAGKAPQVRIMQSNGGILSASAAASEPVRTILSGPAGGVLGAQYAAEAAGFDRIITFDMGGTSTDVALMDGAVGETLAITSESVVSGMPVAVPMMDIHTVGAGGGSIARFDRAGALRVGPESAGAEPGPICYGRGEKATVTDANLILGRIPEAGLLGGSLKLDLARTRAYMNKGRGPMPSAKLFAQGIVDVANAVMEKAIRVISVERGNDPRDYTLVAFGGAGALHACELADALEIPRVLVPPFPGALSALGILRADVTKDLSRTLRLEIQTPDAAASELQRSFAALEKEGRKQMHAEGFSSSSIKMGRSLDIRYAGQSYELNVPFSGNFISSFHQAHEKRFGYFDRTRRCEVVNIRVRLTGRTPKFKLPKLKSSSADSSPGLVSKSQVSFHGHPQLTAIYDRALLHAGNRLPGPAVVTEYSATILIPPKWSGRVDRIGNLILEPRL